MCTWTCSRNPSASLADLLLPAAPAGSARPSCPPFDTAEDTATWAQLRGAVVQPLHESRPDLEIIFDLASGWAWASTSLAATSRRPSTINWRPRG